MQNEERRIKYRRIVNKNNYLDCISKQKLISNINNDKITTKKELEKEISEEKYKTCLRIGLIKIVNEKDILDYTSKWKLESKIDNEEITTKEELKKEIQNEKRKKEYRRIVNENYNLDYDTTR